VSGALLDIRDLVVRFPVGGELLGRLRSRATGIEAVAGVSLQVNEGKTYALVGESGSGKTTLARAVIGLVPVFEGSIAFEGRLMRDLDRQGRRALRRELSMMFQDPVGSLSPRRSVRSILCEPFRVHGVQADLAMEVPRLLAEVGLPAEFGSRYPHQLSGGQARRVGVARALALRPKLVIADEPTAGLDVSVQGELLNLMNELQQRHGIAFLMITHNLHVVRHVADRIGVMYLGRIVEEGPTADIFAAPRHRYTEALLDANQPAASEAHGKHAHARGEVPSLLARPPGCEFHPRCAFALPVCIAERPHLMPTTPAHLMACHNPAKSHTAI
jgi:peptide/nickel transport system ATP-binding protein